MLCNLSYRWLNPEDISFFQNVGYHLQYYTASQFTCFLHVPLKRILYVDWGDENWINWLRRGPSGRLLWWWAFRFLNNRDTSEYSVLKKDCTCIVSWRRLFNPFLRHCKLLLFQDWGNDKLQKAQKQIEESPYDLEAWSLLVREAQGKWIGEMRPLFEKLVVTFPSAGRYWKIYIEQEVCQLHINIFKSWRHLTMIPFC